MVKQKLFFCCVFSTSFSVLTYLSIVEFRILGKMLSHISENKKATKKKETNNIKQTKITVNFTKEEREREVKT